MKRHGQYINLIEQAHYGPEIRDMLDNATCCLNCGKPLKYAENKDKRRNRGYCCQKCYYAKPPKLAYLEREYGKPAREVILELLNETDNVTTTADLVNMGKANFYRVLRKLGIRRVVKWV